MLTAIAIAIVAVPVIGLAATVMDAIDERKLYKDMGIR